MKSKTGPLFPLRFDMSNNKYRRSLEHYRVFEETIKKAVDTDPRDWFAFHDSYSPNTLQVELTFSIRYLMDNPDIDTIVDKEAAKNKYSRYAFAVHNSFLHGKAGVIWKKRMRSVKDIPINCITLPAEHDHPQSVQNIELFKAAVLCMMHHLIKGPLRFVGAPSRDHQDILDDFVKRYGHQDRLEAVPTVEEDGQIYTLVL